MIAWPSIDQFDIHSEEREEAPHVRRAEARDLGARCRDQVIDGNCCGALAVLKPLISSRTPFATLDLIGEQIGPAADVNRAAFDDLLRRLAETEEIGAWPLLGSALAAAFLPHDVTEALAGARWGIRRAQVWHATDALAERVAGEALRADFDTALGLLAAWRDAEDVWLRRATGVAIHRFAMRERESPQHARRLLQFLSPRLEERDTSALKGIGWGLKTLGRTYPDLVAAWLADELQAKQPRRLMIRKAATYLPASARDRFLG
jgi:hypothetical protein